MPNGTHNHLHLVQEILARLVSRRLRIWPGACPLMGNTRELRHERVRRLDVRIHATFANPFGGVALVVDFCPAFRAVHEVDAYAVGILGWHFTVNKSDDCFRPQVADGIGPLGPCLCLIASFGLGLGEEPGQAQGMPVAALPFCFHLNVTSPQCMLFCSGLVLGCGTLTLQDSNAAQSSAYAAGCGCLRWSGLPFPERHAAGSGHGGCGSGRCPS